MPLINEDKLQELYDRDLVYALQLEINDDCEQGCDYCYMNAPTIRKGRLSADTLRRVIAEAAELEVYCIEWLGGEPLLREEVFELMEFAAEAGLRNNMWTGGLPLAKRGTADRCVELTEGGLISFHLSTLNPDIYVKTHPSRPASDLERLIEGVENCLAAGKPPDMMINSTTLTSAQSAEDMIRVIDHFEDEYGIPTSVNVYQFYEPRSEENRDEVLRFAPDLKTVRRTLNHLYRCAGSVARGANCVDKRYCSATAAVLNDGRLTPCATIRPYDAPTIFSRGFKGAFEDRRDWLVLKRMKDKANLPDGCRECKINDECWGCRSKAWDYFQDVYALDPACFRNPVNVKK